MLSIFPASGSTPKAASGDEFVVTRYACVGSSWHINTDGNQVEAVTFQTAMPIKLTSIGLSNSYKRGTKTTINKL
jgi:hypothetical protein